MAGDLMKFSIGNNSINQNGNLKSRKKSNCKEFQINNVIRECIVFQVGVELEKFGIKAEVDYLLYPGIKNEYNIRELLKWFQIKMLMKEIEQIIQHYILRNKGKRDV